MDELSPAGLNDVWEIRRGKASHSVVDASALDLPSVDLGQLKGGVPAENARRAEHILDGGDGDVAGRTAVVLNAGAAIYVAGLASDLTDGLKQARAALDSGAAREALQKLRNGGV
jgi:anthranilate phosphoribosyltransferase